jgi:hypothetical protein
MNALGNFTVSIDTRSFGEIVMECKRCGRPTPEIKKAGAIHHWFASSFRDEPNTAKT